MYITPSVGEVDCHQTVTNRLGAVCIHVTHHVTPDVLYDVNHDLWCHGHVINH